MCVVSDEQIQKWAEEAEAGYDAAELKRRGRGRPGRGAEPAQVVAVRLTAEELEALDAAAQRHDLTRVLRQGSCRISGFESDHTVGVWLTRE